VRPLHFRFAPALFVIATLAACSSKPRHDTEPSVGVPSECDAFVSAYEACLGSSGPAPIAHARADQTRAALADEAQRSPADTLASKCRANLQRLTASCGSTGSAK
jgi:hypothetical protein